MTTVSSLKRLPTITRHVRQGSTRRPLTTPNITVNHNDSNPTNTLVTNSKVSNGSTAKGGNNQNEEMDLPEIVGSSILRQVPHTHTGKPTRNTHLSSSCVGLSEHSKHRRQTTNRVDRRSVCAERPCTTTGCTNVMMRFLDEEVRINSQVTPTDCSLESEVGAEVSEFEELGCRSDVKAYRENTLPPASTSHDTLIEEDIVILEDTPPLHHVEDFHHTPKPLRVDTPDHLIRCDEAQSHHEEASMGGFSGKSTLHIPSVQNDGGCVLPTPPSPTRCTLTPRGFHSVRAGASRSPLALDESISKMPCPEFPDTRRDDRNTGTTRRRGGSRSPGAHGRSAHKEEGEVAMVAAPPRHPLRSSVPSLSYSNSQMSKILLGTGSYGSVFKAMDRETNRIFAVKEIHLVREDATQLEQVCREIRLMKQLHHPRIVQYYGSARDGDRLYVQMEFVDGGSLARILKEFGPLQEHQAALYTTQVVEGLAYLHAQSVVHRDLKGENILVDCEGRVKLADFGASRELQTLAQTLIGTSHFMAPEVIRGTGYAFPADIWSLGCCVVEMLTGRPPFSELDLYAAMTHICGVTEPWSTLLRPLEGQDAQLVEKCISDVVREDGHRVEVGALPAPTPRGKKALSLPIPIPVVSQRCFEFVKACMQPDPTARPTARQLLNHPWLEGCFLN